MVTPKQIAHMPDSLEHICFIFIGKSQDDMDNDGQASLFQSAVGIVKNLQGISSVDALCGLITGGLKSQFHPDRLDPVQLSEHPNLITSETVGPGTDGENADFRPPDGFLIERTEPFHIAVGIGVGLKVCNVQPLFCRDRGGDLLIHTLFCKTDLLFDRQERGGEFSGSAV